jgi:2,3-bisphosphoglycerate-independent phosphoglycerate mutase
MKYVIVLGDGMADEQVESLGGLTPLAYAKTPNMDLISKISEIGLAKTVPEGMKPGSDTANLSVLGYDPKVYYSGRSPLEALNIGVPMKDSDIAIRCNFVTLSSEEDVFEDKTMIDHSASEISTEDAATLLADVKKELEDELYQFYVGTSYRHCLIWNGGSVIDLTPPHDILGKKIKTYLPEDKMMCQMMKKSHEILKNHPLNKEREKQGLHPANSCWFWGAGTKPTLKDFREKTGKKGMMISAVDLLKGIAVGSHMAAPMIEGANGGLHTNYQGKMQKAVDALTKEDYDFVYIHVEAPDEMGHQGELDLKIQAIENLDEKVIGPLMKQMREQGVDYRMLVLPDHPTPISIRTHTSDPVPYVLYDSTKDVEGMETYNEKTGAESGNFFAKGHELIDHLFEK